MQAGCEQGALAREKVPKDGVGPRGVPECYYTSRVLNSTARYVRFVKKLRALEDEQRRGRENTLKETKDKQYNDFFIKCDRRSLINTVAHRVDLCLASYEEDLKKKRMRLKELLSKEEELNIHKFVAQAQEGAAAAWQDKMARLDYLVAKRNKEHQDKYAATPLSKCAHVQPCLVKIRAKEAQEVQLYQIREKQMRKMADSELDKMWYELAMKESEALAARLELDQMERRRRDAECMRYTALQLQELREKRDREREMLKQEAIALRREVEAWTRQEAEEKLKMQEKNRQIGEERQNSIREHQEVIAKEQEEARRIQETWDSLRGQNIPIDKSKEEQRNQKERDLDECNRKLAELKHNFARYKFNNEPLILKEGQRLRGAQDLKRCIDRKMKQKATKETSEAVQQQFKEQQERVEAREQEAREREYQRQVDAQLEQLIAHKEITDAQARKLHQNDLLEQIKYNQLLKERALQEEMEQRKKCQLAQQQYQEEIKAMLNRPFYSDKVHPFAQVMATGLRMDDKCPCSAPDYCAKSAHAKH